MRKEHAPPFFAPISGPARNGKQGKRITLAIFQAPAVSEKCLLGAPQTRPLLATVTRSDGAMRLVI